jgi:hypothetical protein
MFFQPPQRATTLEMSGRGGVSPLLLARVDRRLNYLYSFFSNTFVGVLLSGSGLFLDSSTFTAKAGESSIAGKINPFNPVGYCLY